MGLFRRGLIKAGMIVGGIFAAGAAVGAAAKAAYKKKRNSYNTYESNKTYDYTKPNNATVNNSAAKNASTVDLMNKEHAVFKSGQSTQKPNYQSTHNSSTYVKTSGNTQTVYRLKPDDKIKQKEVQKRIEELSKPPISANGLGAVLLSYLIPFMFIFVGLLAGYIINMLELGQFISLSIFSFAFLIYLSLLTGAFKYKKNTKKTREEMENIRYNLNYYKKLKDSTVDSINNDYSTEVVVYQTALRNMANTYNDYISQFSNLLYTKIFSIAQFDCEENVQQENIILTRTK
ncbi:MAG: SoxR reducing system RseC family protein [Bacilli bacterium]|nr:SoxR reducing system RseC family protein [Bacilli bacterium]